ncbi:MAG: ribonuclease [Bacteroidota bacterium]|jgi:ribonuclease HI
MIYIFTDGSSRGNPGKGGFGVVLISGPHRKELSKGFKLTTNNRMELLAAIEGLECLKADGMEVTLVSDSKYVVDAVEKGWLTKWLRTNFAGGKKNADLWIRFSRAYKRHKVKMQWVKGHNGHPENERCDQLAVAAAMGSNLLDDFGFLSEQNTLGL